MRQFIEKIKQSDKPVRRRWFIIFSAVAGLLVLIIWVVQFKISFSELTHQDETLASLDEGKSMFEELGAAISLSLSQIKDKTGGAIEAIKEAVNQTNDLEIKPEE